MDIDNIPNEIVVYIFTFIPSKSWFDVMLVCKRFLYIGKSIYINFLLKPLGRNAFDPSINQNRAIVLATENGRTNIIRWLLQDSRVDPTVNHNAPLRIAAERGHLDTLRELLKANKKRTFRLTEAGQSNGPFV